MKEAIEESPHFERTRETSKLRETSKHVLEYFFLEPITGITEISQALEMAYNTAGNVVKRFLKLGIISECTTIRSRNTLYKFDPYINLLLKEYS